MGFEKCPRSEQGFIVFKTFEDGPPDSDALKFLLNPKSEYDPFIMRTPPVRPKAGQIFLYKPKKASNTVSIRDQHRWFSSEYKIDEENQIKRQKYYSRDIENCVYNREFKRNIYYSLLKNSEDRIYLIAYVGNESSFKDAPHLNRKKDLKR
jgi:hypothetical protein